MKQLIGVIAVAVIVVAGPMRASAVTQDYMFVAGQSTVVQTGGIGGISRTYTVGGQFRLAVDFGARTASFEWVDATLGPGQWLPSRSLDRLFFMTALLGTVADDSTLVFVSPWLAPCPDVRLTVELGPDSARLTCRYCECSADGFCYELDAVAHRIAPGWTYEYSDDFETDKAKKDSYAHAVFWPGSAFAPDEPYLYYYDPSGRDRALAFMDYGGQPAHLGYRFPITPQGVRGRISGILKLHVQFPSDAYISQSPPGYLLYSVSSDGQIWSPPEHLAQGQNQIPVESLLGSCYVMFLGTRAVIDDLAVHLHSSPATIRVPADFATIQAAINAASDGDVIEVAPGIYRGPGNRDIDFLGKAITVRSSAGSERTIIDCSGQGGASGGRHRGFYFHRNEQRDSVLSGFTIINGRIPGSDIPADNMRWGLSAGHPIGGGIYCEFSSPTIVDCVVRQCGTEAGGGIGCVGGRAVIVNCVVAECTAGGFGPAESGGMGGGIALLRNADVKLVNCRISNNTVYHNGLGAGLYARRAEAVLSGCEIASNGPRSEGGFLKGGGVYCSDPQTSVVLKNCILSNNSAVSGTAVFAQRGTAIPGCTDADCPPCRVRITNCTIAHNRLVAGPWMKPIADGAVQSAGAEVTLKNSIVYYNEGIQVLLVDAPPGAVSYCDIEYGYQGPGNISEAPLFAPTAVPDYHLQSVYGRFNPQSGQWVIDDAHSPCIDAGDPADPVGREPVPNGRRINMGAYGGTDQASKGRSRRVYHVDATGGDDSNSGLSRAEAFATVQRGIDAARDGDTVLVWPGVYVEDVLFPMDSDGTARAITVQSAADAAVVVARTAYAFSFYTAEQGDTVLRNLVITGCAEGAIYCDNGASPTLTNLTIAGNAFGVNAVFNADPDISNCILWDNTFGDLSGCRASYSCVEKPDTNLEPGIGNISTEPLFADPQRGDYHLRSRFGRYWSEHGLWVIDDLSSPCIDAADPQVYPRKERMPNGGRLNMGAYGGTPFASMSQWPLRSDVDRNGVVNWNDFALLAESWLDSLPWAPRQLEEVDIVMPTDGSVIRSPGRYGQRGPADR